MISDGSFLSWCNDFVFTFQPADNTVDGTQKIIFLHLSLVVPGCDQCGLVADVGNVGSRESRSLTGQKVTVDMRIEFQILEMHIEDFAALFEIGQFDVDLAVEPAGTQQRFVQNVGPVGCGQDNDSGVRPESVHLCQQLVQRIFAFVIRRVTDVFASGPSDGVDFIDEDDARCFLLGLAEQVAHARCPDADKHLDEIRSADREERDVGLSGHGFGQQGFTCTRRSYQQGSFWNFTS